jgi:hypothetical protein
MNFECDVLRAVVISLNWSNCFVAKCSCCDNWRNNNGPPSIVRRCKTINDFNTITAVGNVRRLSKNGTRSQSVDR